MVHLSSEFRRLTSRQFPSAEVEGFRSQLKEIKATMVDGKFLSEDSTAPAGQGIVIGLLDRCFLWSDIVLTRSAPTFFDLSNFLTHSVGRAKSMKDSNRHMTSSATSATNWSDLQSPRLGLSERLTYITFNGNWTGWMRAVSTATLKIQLATKLIYTHSG